jgi:hypothetical protein
MSSADPAGNVVARLSAAVASGALPPGTQARAERLLGRLTAPVRVAVLGLPGSGRTGVLNLLAGRRVVADGAGLPSLSVMSGPVERTVLIGFGGRETPRAGPPPAAAALPADVERIRVEMPLPVLSRIALYEPAMGRSRARRAAAVAAAAEEADILLWCTQGFGAEERALWRAVPDAAKDHSFLVLAKADRLMAEGALADRMSALEPIVAEEFLCLLPVATPQALAAFGRDGGPDEAALKASGGRALIAAVTRHVDEGRRADMDAALLFLSRLGADAPLAAPAAGRPARPARPSRPATARRASRPAPEPAPGPDDSRRGPLGAMLAQLRERAADLAAIAGEDAAADPQRVLDHCAETAESLAAMAPDGPTGEDGCDALCEDVHEAAETMLLLQLEAGARPAEDAVTLLLQLRRDLEAAMR